MKPTTALRQLLAAGNTLVAPGAYDGLSARLVEQAGFKVIYASGGAISRSAGYPDLGLLSVTEVLSRLEKMVDVTSIPIIADADTGFGNSLNVARTVKQFARIGIAGLHLEDQQFPKRCGHLDNKQLITTEEMQRKIAVARHAAADDDFLLIARTDAIAVEDFDRAITRAEAYLKAGADMIFVEAPQTLAQVETIASRISAPKLINMFEGGKTPLVALDRLQELGFALVIIPSDLQRAAIHAMQQTLATIAKNGNSHAIRQQLTTFKEREAIIQTDKYLELDR